MTDTQFRKGDVVRFTSGRFKSPSALEKDRIIRNVSGDNVCLYYGDGIYNSKRLRLVYRPPTREEYERQMRELTEMRDALVAWAKEERKSGQSGFSTAPMMRLIHLGRRLLAEEETANNV